VSRSGPPSRGPSARHWIACADDFAIDRGAVDGIVDLIERGRITATSALVDSPLWSAAARALPQDVRSGTREALPRADVGLHLNLTQAFPAQRTVVWPLGELLARCALGAVPRAAVRGAIEHQLDAFEDRMGRHPDYVDGHQHVHQFAVVRGELLAALRRRYPGARTWLRSTRAPRAVRDFKARSIAALGDRRLRQMAASSNFPTSAYLVGVYRFGADAGAYWRRLRQWVRSGPDGTVLMSHPSLRPEPGDSIGAARCMEYAALASTEFGALLAEAQITLTTGSRLLAATNDPTGDPGRATASRP